MKFTKKNISKVTATSEVQLCDKCSGNGTYIEVDGNMIDEYVRKCQTCDGTGRVVQANVELHHVVVPYNLVVPDRVKSEWGKE